MKKLANLLVLCALLIPSPSLAFSVKSKQGSGIPVIALRFTADKTLVKAGEAVTLTYKSKNASSCRGDNFTNDGYTSGKATVYPTQNTTYTVTCFGHGETPDGLPVSLVATESVKIKVLSQNPIPSTKSEARKIDLFKNMGSVFLKK